MQPSHSATKRTYHMPHKDPSEVMTAVKSQAQHHKPVTPAQHRQGHVFCLYSKGLTTPSHPQRSHG